MRPLVCYEAATAGFFPLEPHFVPPLLEVGGSEYLLSIVRRLVEILAACVPEDLPNPELELNILLPRAN